MVSGEYQRLVDGAVAALKTRNAEADTAFGLSGFERYEYDLATSRFWWSSAGVPRVEASVVAVGSISTKTGTWLWAWANPHLSDRLSAEIETVRAYGAEHGFERLTTAKWTGDEIDGWEMTALAAMVLGSAAAYRSPNESGALFLLLSGIRRLEGQGTSVGGRDGSHPRLVASEERALLGVLRARNRRQHDVPKSPKQQRWARKPVQTTEYALWNSG